MPRRKLPRPQPGDYLTADLLNQLYIEIERLNLTVGSNLILSKTQGGMTIAANCVEQFWAKITGASVTLTAGPVAYPWTEQIPIEGGTWEDGPRAGTTDVDVDGNPTGDPAIESNGNDTVAADKIVLVTRIFGVLGFTYRKCS